MKPPRNFRPSHSLAALLPLPVLLIFGGYLGSLIAQDEDASFEGLYQKAGEQSVSGDFAGASATFEKLFDLSGGHETLFEDYGAAAGGVFFDYGMTLVPQSRFEDAKAAFLNCIGATAEAKRVESPIKSTNARESLAKFQLGFCEAQLGNHGEAIRLYDEYLASSPSPEETAQVRNSYKLRYGTSLMALGRTAEGVAAIQELFDNRDAWKVNPQFLMQGLLELGLGWVERAVAAGQDEAAMNAVADQANAFLDKNGDLIRLEPLDQYRFGFIDRLRKLGFESTKAGLYSVALRYFSFLPTLEDVKQDLNLSLARQPFGTGIPSQYQKIIDQIAEREKAPIHPDAETLRLVASCYERLGNNHAARVIYWTLAENFPEVPAELRGEILHEAARLSAVLADFPAAQYFGEKFVAEMPEDHPLRNNVSTFMLQSLFTAREYGQVIDIAGRVRERYEAGDAQRELADSLYPLALYSSQKFTEAEPAFAEYLKAYPEGGNREIVMFHSASNALVLGKMREAAERYEDFLKFFPESERFLENVLADLSVSRFNLEDYTAAIAASDKLLAARPDSVQVPRTLNIAGDAYFVQAGKLNIKEQAEQKKQWEDAGLAAYLSAIEKGKVIEAKDPDRADYHKLTVAEALWKSADQYYTREEFDKGLAQYDAFFPDYVGNNWEAQISVFSLEHLEAAGRGEEGLAQVEKTIIQIGSKAPEEQDLTLLRQAIGSYSEASVRIRGLEATIAQLDKFPGADPANKSLTTWLKIQKVIVLQESRKKLAKDSTEFAAVEAQIDAVFEELRLFEKRDLSEYALQQVGLYFSGTDNPFRGVPYFEELLARQNPEADPFKAPAELALGEIEARDADAGKVQSARERFRRIIDKYKDAALTPQAYLSLAKLHIKSKEWKDAAAALRTINEQKNYFKDDRAKRAEAGFLYGTALDELGDPVGANQAYVAVMGAYRSFHDLVVQAWERYIPNSIADFDKMDISTPEKQAEKRARQLSLYKLTTRYLYEWQGLTDEDVPSGALARLRRTGDAMVLDLAITPEEKAKVDFELGINRPN